MSAPKKAVARRMIAFKDALKNTTSELRLIVLDERDWPRLDKKIYTPVAVLDLRKEAVEKAVSKLVPTLADNIRAGICGQMHDCKTWEERSDKIVRAVLSALVGKLPK